MVFPFISDSDDAAWNSSGMSVSISAQLAVYWASVVHGHPQVKQRVSQAMLTFYSSTFQFRN